MRHEHKTWLQKLRDFVVDVFITAESVFRRRPPETTRESFRAGLPRLFKRILLMTTGIIIIMAAAVFARYILQVAPKQPIPFSHRFHVGSKKLNCLFCHNSATRSSNAGMPPVQKCLLCHNVIASHFWPIQNLRGYYARKKPVPWVWVNNVPRFVHFNHQAHLTRGIDCGHCHGNVAAMDIVQPAHRFDMNFCITCHWRNKGPDSCFACHY